MLWNSIFKKLTSQHPVPSPDGKQMGEKNETMEDFIFLGSKVTEDNDCSREIKRHLLFGRKSYDQPRQCIKRQEHHFDNKGLSTESFEFSSSHVQMWESDHKEGCARKNWYFWIVVLEKTLGSPLDWKEIQPVHPKGDQYWVFIGRTDAEAPILWPPDAKSRLMEKDSDAVNDWGQKEKGVTEDEMLVWHHRLMDMSLSKLWEILKDREPGVLQSMGSQRVGHNLATEQ